MNISKWGAVVTAVAVITASSHAAAPIDWFAKLGTLYGKGTVPTVTHLKAEQAWTGKCAHAGSRTKREGASLFVHIDRDPLAPATFHIIPLFDPKTSQSYESSRNKALDLILGSDGENGLVNLSSEQGAWVVKVGKGSDERSYYLKETQIKDTSGKAVPIVLLRALSAARETVAFCYFYSTLAPSSIDPKLVTINEASLISDL